MHLTFVFLCLLPLADKWAAHGQPENDLVGDLNKYHDKRQNYGVCCNGRRRAGKRSFATDSSFLERIENEIQANARSQLAVQRSLQDSYDLENQIKQFGGILWNALVSSNSGRQGNNGPIKRQNGPNGVSFGTDKRDPGPIGVSFGTGKRDDPGHIGPNFGTGKREPGHVGPSFGVGKRGPWHLGPNFGTRKREPEFGDALYIEDTRYYNKDVPGPYRANGGVNFGTGKRGPGPLGVSFGSGKR